MMQQLLPAALPIGFNCAEAELIPAPGMIDPLMHCPLCRQDLVAPGPTARRGPCRTIRDQLAGLEQQAAGNRCTATQRWEQRLAPASPWHEYACCSQVNHVLLTVPSRVC